MDTWKQVGCGIRLVQKSAEHREDVVVREVDWPQVMSVWIDRGNDQENGHSGEQKGAKLIVFTFVVQGKICDSPGNICKPHQVWDNKILTEWNQIIQRSVYHMKMCGNGLFNIAEPGQIYKEIK